jgi:hypothetical protein
VPAHEAKAHREIGWSVDRNVPDTIESCPGCQTVVRFSEDQVDWATPKSIVRNEWIWYLLLE